MHKRNTNSQAGFALLIFLVMMMGVGGIVLAGYTQGILKQVEESKFTHNERVLKEAKQALLQFAYNYPVTNGKGPGRLPCADTDNDGTPNTIFGACTSLGRLPWNQQNLNLYDIRDADGQRLWYAVSDNFATQTAANLNSDAFGTITLRDQSGKVIYDGSNPGGLAKYGVAAIIIAPGKITARNGVTQDRSVANADDPFDTTADTDPGIIDAVNYLDRLVGTEDNADFIQGSATDGFILGPVDIQSTDAVNDQMIVITAADVIEVAEKATLQAYRTAINNYLAVTGNVYPWLYNYITACFGEAPPGSGITEAICILNGGVWRGPIGIGDLTSLYPAHADFNDEITYELDNIGRIPSIFENYFTETNSQPIESKLSVVLPITYPATLIPVGATGTTLPANAVVRTFNIQTADKLTDVKFVDIADTVGKDGRLTGTAIAPELFTQVIYFWDDDDSPTGIWTICPDGADELRDCWRDGAGNPDPGGLNDNKEEILRVFVELEFDPAVNGGVVNFDTDYTSAPVIAPPVAATGTTHASITGTFLGADVIVNSLPLSVRYEIDRHYHDWTEGNTFTIEETGTLDLTDLVPGALTLGLRYYPVLPDWAFDNGWHDSIMMAYAQVYRPDTLADPCTEGTDCIQINNLAGNNDNKISILTIAGQHDWFDEGADGFTNDVGDVFDVENENLDRIFDARANPGNDRILIIDEL